jgi:hypothetical protein
LGCGGVGEFDYGCEVAETVILDEVLHRVVGFGGRFGAGLAGEVGGGDVEP